VVVDVVVLLQQEVKKGRRQRKELLSFLILPFFLL